MKMDTTPMPFEHLIWSLVEENGTQRIFLYEDDINCTKLGVITLKYGILKCYPVINDEIIWGDNLCFECLDDCDTKRFEDVPEDIMDKMIEKSEAAIIKYYEDYANDLDEEREIDIDTDMPGHWAEVPEEHFNVGI